jgi:hypothetical protein
MWIRRTAIAITALQVIGAIGTIFWPVVPGRLRQVFWGTGFVALLPGDILGPWAVQHFLWRSGVSLRVVGVISLVASILVNVGIAALLLGVASRSAHRAA